MHPVRIMEESLVSILVPLSIGSITFASCSMKKWVQDCLSFDKHDHLSFPSIEAIPRFARRRLDSVRQSGTFALA